MNVIGYTGNDWRRTNQSNTIRINWHRHDESKELALVLEDERYPNVGDGHCT